MKTFCVLIFLDIKQVFNNLQELYKNEITCLKTRGFDVFNVSGIKYRVRYRQNCLIKLNSITFWKLSLWRKHLSIYDFQFYFCIFKSYHLSLFNYIISIRTCSFTVSNSTILSSLRSDLPILILQYSHTICTFMVVDVNTSYWT